MSRLELVAWLILIVLVVLMIHAIGIDVMLETLRRMFDHDCPGRGVCL